MGNIVKWQGRPTKLTKVFINALDKVIEEPTNILLNQEELIEEVNFRLKPVERIHYKTFQDWKNKNYLPDSVEEETLEAFSSTLKKMNRLHKQAIAKGILSEGAGSWQKFAWIAERMHNELNLTHKVDHTSKGDSIKKINFIQPDEIESAEYVEVEQSND